MKLLCLFGAVKNAGDFLIAHRTKALLNELLPECELLLIWEGTDFNTLENRQLLDECDGIVFCGGPFFTGNIYPHDIPLIMNLEEIDKPMINIGGDGLEKMVDIVQLKRIV